MRRAVIVFSSAGVCAVAAVLFLWSVSPRGPAEGVTPDAHRDGDATARTTVAFADRPLSAPVPVPVPMPTATDAPPAAASDRPHDDTMASSTTATDIPKVEVAMAHAAPAAAPAPAPSLVPATTAATTAKVGVADSSGDITVGQKNREFTVKAARVKVGGTIKFVNDDTVAHNIIVTVPGGKLRNTGVQEPGQSASMQFGEPGTYDVECAIHPQMKMMVNVQ
jgi:plastocyanin